MYSPCIPHVFRLLLSVCSILIAAMYLQIAELRELTEVTLGGGWSKAEVRDNDFRRNMVFIDHEIQNIDQFLCQRGLYRPFIDHFLLQLLFIDHFF